MRACGVRLCVGLLGFLVFGSVAGRAQSAAAKGQALFASKGCAHCHGDQAQGTDRGPDLRDLKPRPSKSHMQEQIVKGGDGMPPFGDVLSQPEVKELIAYLRSLKPVPGGAAAAKQAAMAGQGAAPPSPEH